MLLNQVSIFKGDFTQPPVSAFILLHSLLLDAVSVSSLTTSDTLPQAHCSDLLIQIHLDALSAASEVDLMPLLLAAPVMPSIFMDNNNKTH